jgi:integrase
MKRLNFTNRTIFNWKSDFSPGPKSKTGKSKVRVYTPFHMDKHTQFKGLNLCEYIKGEKHFVIKFRIKGQREKPRVFSLGRFDNNLNIVTGETKFGIKQCQERLFKIAKEHQDEYGHWIKDPNLTVSFTQVNQSISIRKLIEEYAKAGFEKMFNAEKMKGNSIRDKVRHLFGYNLRVRHLEYDTDDKGDGYVRFVPQKQLRNNDGEIKSINKPAPKDWDELFKWYPPGKLILKDHRFNMSGNKSIYDDVIGKINIEDLRTKLIIDHLNQYNSHSAKYDAMECFRTLWHFAVHRGYMENDAMINPTYLVPIKKGRPVPNKYKLKIFSDSDWELLLTVCNDLSHRYPWQTDAIVLQALTGLRRTESFQLKKSDLKYWETPKVLTNKAGQKQIVYGEIHIRPAVSKMGQEEWIPIIEPIQTCLNNIKGIPNRHFTYHSKMYNKSHRNYGLAYAKGLPWLFCSTQVQISELFDSKYRFSSKTRLRTDHHCWLEIRREMKKRKGLSANDEFLCTSKMLRKTFTHKAKRAFDGRSDIAKRFTRHTNEDILEGRYDGVTREEIHQNSTELAVVLDFVKKRA